MGWRSPEVYPKRVNRQKYWQCHHNHRKEKIFTDQRYHKWRRGANVRQQQEEDGQCQEDRDGERDLLPAVWGQVEHQYRQTGNGQTRHDQVEGVEQGSSAKGDVEHDVWVRLRAAWVELLHPAGRDVDYIPLDVLIEVLEVNATIDDLDLGILVKHGLRVTNMLQVNLKTVIRPRAKLHKALLHIKGKELHVDWAVTFVNCWRFPHDSSRVMNGGLCQQGDFKRPICANMEETNVLFKFVFDIKNYRENDMFCFFNFFLNFQYQESAGVFASDNFRILLTCYTVLYQASKEIPKECA